MVCLRYYTSIDLKGLGKPMKNLSINSLFLGQDLNLGPLEYETRVVMTLHGC
jgi:hypothetical protein